MSQARTQTYERKNPGPAWGADFLVWIDAILPERIFNFLLLCGCFVSVPMMKARTRASKKWLRSISKKKAGWREVSRHYYQFMQSLLELLRMAKQPSHTFTCVGPAAGDFQDFLRSGKPALFGTFHVGNSDLLGYALGILGRKIGMVRMRSGNSAETRNLMARFHNNINMIWVDKPENILYEIKRTIQSGESLAIKCDRMESASKGDRFYFSGANREFPFTIYHLATLFNLPVWFCIGIPTRKGHTDVYPFPVYAPIEYDKKGSLVEGKNHFQSVLNGLETILTENPYLWFNFITDEDGYHPAI